VSSVLMFFNFALPLFPAFLKMDLSDAPALIAAFALDPRAGVMVAFVKNAINLTHTATGGIGELANFSIGLAFVLPAGFLYRREKTLRRAISAMGVGVLTMTAAAAVANYFVLLPLYSRFFPLDAIIDMYRAVNPYANTLWKVVLMSIVPFNLIKGFFVSLLTFGLYKRLGPFVKG
jgi:Predicted membrane protein